MKRKDLINYIKEEIVEVLSEDTIQYTDDRGEDNIANITPTSPEGVQSIDTLKKNQKIKKVINTTKNVKLKEMANVAEMANIASIVKIQDANKFALAKEIYTGGRTAAILSALEEVGDEGITPQALAEKIGAKASNEINLILNNLRAAGVISGKRDKLVKPEKGAKEEEPEIEEPETDGDDWESSESEDDWENEPEEEETSEEEPEEEETPEEEPVATTKASDDLGKWVDELAKLNAKKDDLVKKLKAKEITMDQYKEMIGNIPTQIKALQAKIDRI